MYLIELFHVFNNFNKIKHKCEMFVGYQVP